MCDVVMHQLLAEPMSTSRASAPEQCRAAAVSGLNIFLTPTCSTPLYHAPSRPPTHPPTGAHPPIHPWVHPPIYPTRLPACPPRPPRPADMTASRTDVPEYQKLRSMVHEIVGRINGQFGTLTYVPIYHLDTSLSFTELCALYAVTGGQRGARPPGCHGCRCGGAWSGRGRKDGGGGGGSDHKSCIYAISCTYI